MDLFSCFQDGFIFTSGKYSVYQGAYGSVPERPCLCDKCQSQSGRFHAHGRYERWVKTLKNAVLTPVRVWRQRWLCLCCGRSMSNGTPDVLPNIPICTLVILALFWSYLVGSEGYSPKHPTGAGRGSHTQNPGPLPETGKSRLSGNPTSYPGGIDRNKRTQAMG